MTDTDSADAVRPFVVARAMRRHWLTVALVTLLVGAAAGAFAFLRPHTYSSTATVFIRPLAGNALSNDALRNPESTTVAMETEANLVDSIAVAQRVGKALGSTPAAGSTALSAAVPPNTQIIRITYVAKTRLKAKRYAQAFATAYLDYRSDLAATTKTKQLAALAKQVKSTAAKLQAAEVVAKAKNAPADAKATADLYASLLTSLEKNRASVQSLSIQPGTVTASAHLPSRASVVIPIGIALGGAVLGFLLGVGIAWWRDRRDDRIHLADDVVAGLAVLAAVPAAPRATLLTGRSRSGPTPEEADAYRRARTGVVAGSRPPSVIAVSPVTDGEVSAAVAVRLARLLSASGFRVALVDAAIDSARVTALLGVDPKRGLSDVLVDGDDEPEWTTVDGVRVMSAGTQPVAARERYSGNALATVLADTRATVDYLIVSTSPLTSSDGLAVMLVADTVLAVAATPGNTHQQVAEVHELARRLRVDLLGLVVVQRGRKYRGHAEKLLPYAAGHTVSAEPSPSSPPPTRRSERRTPDADGDEQNDDTVVIRSARTPK